MSDEDMAVSVAVAVTAIRKAASIVGKSNSDIDDVQIKELREAIDQLELKLNEQKRRLDAASQ